MQLERVFSQDRHQWATRYRNGWTIYKPGVGVIDSGLTFEQVNNRFGGVARIRVLVGKRMVRGCSLVSLTDGRPQPCDLVTLLVESVIQIRDNLDLTSWSISSTTRSGMSNMGLEAIQNRLLEKYDYLQLQIDIS
jgi:hypothetical protein